MTRLLNEYKDFLEIELIAARSSAFIKRQKGQLKLDNSVLEEFLIDLTHPTVLTGLPDFPLTVGPNNRLQCRCRSLPSGDAWPQRSSSCCVEVKDQDFIIGKEIYYRFSPRPSFRGGQTTTGSLSLAVLAAETKVNLDKTVSRSRRHALRGSSTVARIRNTTSSRVSRHGGGGLSAHVN
jgi:hypothetical protein